MMMLLMQTLFPEPVAPAIRRCGMSLRLATTLVPEMPLPRPTEILDLAFLNSLESMISRRYTAEMASLEISMPTAALPGMGASILRLFALRFRAKSS